MDYKIGKIEGNLPHLFVVGMKDGNIIYCAEERFRRYLTVEQSKAEFNAIGAENGLDKLLGFGHVGEPMNGTVWFTKSYHLGGVPAQVIEKLEESLQTAYKTRFPEIREIHFDKDNTQIKWENWQSIIGL